MGRSDAAAASWMFRGGSHQLDIRKGRYRENASVPEVSTTTGAGSGRAGAARGGDGARGSGATGSAANTMGATAATDNTPGPAAAAG